ncbi:MAG: cytochrome c-type biogenesis protein [Stappiaceae bacterium]
MRSVITLLCLLIAVHLVGPALAVTPDEVLDDPVLEQRARDLSVNLRCMVCQNQSIDDSDAPLAKDLRVLVRERLVAGDTNEEVTDYLVSRYGEFVLLKPRFAWHTAILWFLGPAILLIGLISIILKVRGKSKPGARVAQDQLSDEEKKRLNQILTEDR